MMTRKKTLEMATPRRTGDEEFARAREFRPEVLERVETVSPLDDLEFCELESDVKPLDSEESQKKPVIENQPVQVTKLEKLKKRFDLHYLHDLPRKYYFTIALAVLCLIIGLYLITSQSYSVETRLVFIVGDRTVLEKENWSPLRELSVLQNPKTGSMLSRRYYDSVDPINVFNRIDQNSPDPLSLGSTVINPLSLRKDYFRNPMEFESWLSKSIVFEPEFYGGQNRVTIKLTGPDPELLKGLLLDYVASYVDLRRAIQARSQDNTKPPVQKEPDSDNSAKLKSLEVLNDKVKKLDSLQNEYQLALRLMDSGSGSVSAFSLDPNSPVFTTLARFQDKIIQLEIERGSLETRFTPQSREIKSIEFQIDGVKGLMRQYLTEQVDYLKKDKEMLVAQMTELEEKSSPKPNPEPKERGKLSGMLASGANWYFLNDALSVISENPFVTSKPLMGKLGDFKNALVSSLFASTSPRNGPRPYGDPMGAYPTGQYYDQPQFRGGTPYDYGPPRQSSMDTYRNDINSFVRR